MWAVQDLTNGRRRNPVNSVVLFWNSGVNTTGFTHPSEIELNKELINLGRSGKVFGNVFFGLNARPAERNPAGRGADVGIGRGGPSSNGQ
jgi:hypothetical protein